VLLGALACVYQSINDAVTAEEGLNYSIPGMRGDSRYSPEHIRKAQAVFQQLDRDGDRWMTVAGVLFLIVIVSGASGYRLLRSAR